VNPHLEPRELLSAQRLQQRVGQLAEAISSDYGEQRMVLVGVLKGSLFFLADLARRIRTPLAFELVRVSTYGAGRRPSRPASLSFATDLDVKGRHVLVVEDIVDTGRTLRFVRELLLAEAPQSLKICALLDKPTRREVSVNLDYVGFQIPDRFVVGYGLDHAERYRNLPYVGYLDDPD
jgi:hypoxanthine phosphoribosyltransferase